MPEQKVNARIEEIAQKISSDYAGQEVHLICILKGSVFFTCELAKRITVPVTMDFMSVSSYGNDTKSSGVVKIIKDRQTQSAVAASVYPAGQTGAPGKGCQRRLYLLQYSG